MLAQEIFRKSCDAFEYQDANTLYEYLTEPLFARIRQGIKERKGGRFAMKLYEFNSPPEVLHNGCVNYIYFIGRDYDSTQTFHYSI